MNIFARDEDKAAFEEYHNRMKGIGLFVDTDSVKNKVMEFGPIIVMDKRKQFLRIRGEMAIEIGIAKREEK